MGAKFTLELLNKGDYNVNKDLKDGQKIEQDLVGGGDRDNDSVNMSVTWTTETKQVGGDDVLLGGARRISFTAAKADASSEVGSGN